MKNFKKYIYSRYAKRGIDFLISLIALVILAPILLLIGIIIKLDSPGPIIYKQLRVGKDTKEFYIYKFRTMVSNADKIGPNKTVVQDTRITRIGGILRKFSLDELPQLINVLIGDMSLVGYRPGLKEHYSDDEIKSHLFNYKPGITGYAQINGRSKLTRDEKRSWEFKYCDDISLITDVKIIIQTIQKVIIREGAN